MKTISSDRLSLLQMTQLIEEWKTKYHLSNKHELVFQNKELLSNIILPNNYLHKNHLAGRGFDNLPEAVINPSECWSYWKDPNPKHQKDVIRNYLLIGENLTFVVNTINGVIQKAIAVVPSRVNRYRRGLILLKNG